MVAGLLLVLQSRGGVRPGEGHRRGELRVHVRQDQRDREKPVPRRGLVPPDSQCESRASCSFGRAGRCLFPVPREREPFRAARPDPRPRAVSDTSPGAYACASRASTCPSVASRPGPLLLRLPRAHLQRGRGDRPARRAATGSSPMATATRSRCGVRGSWASSRPGPRRGLRVHELLPAQDAHRVHARDLPDGDAGGRPVRRDDRALLAGGAHRAELSAPPSGPEAASSHPVRTGRAQGPEAGYLVRLHVRIACGRVRLIIAFVGRSPWTSR